MTEHMTDDEFIEAHRKSLLPLAREVVLQTALIKQMFAYLLSGEPDPRSKAEGLRDSLLAVIEQNAMAESLAADVREFYDGLMQKLPDESGTVGDDDWGLASALKQ